jgi:hypothetical protein
MPPTISLSRSPKNPPASSPLRGQAQRRPKMRSRDAKILKRLEVLLDKMRRLSDVRVPSDCYMVIVTTTDDSVKALGVVMPQRRVNQEPLKDFVTSIDAIEGMVGIDFLSELPDDVENALEAKDADNADPSWNIHQLLKPTFAGNARPIKVKDCD